MEAATLQTKKTVNKGKIKKTLKNVLFRPDPVFWPLVSDNQKEILEAALNEYKVKIPQFKKPHWNKLKLISKEKRPKPPKLKRVDGLLFGTSECLNSIKTNTCAVVILEATVNPRTIVQPVIEACINSRVPVICVSNLRTTSTKYFGIPTCCLGIKCDCLPDLRTQVLDIAKSFKLPQKETIEKTECIEMKDAQVKESFESKPAPISCPYLYRTSKKTRIFNPSGATKDKMDTNFIGQDFIEFSEKKDASAIENNNRKAYIKMVLKKISNNPKRVKIK